MKLAGRRGIVETQTRQVARRQADRVERPAAAAAAAAVVVGGRGRRLGDGVLARAGRQPAAPQLEPGPALGDDHVQPWTASDPQRVGDHDRHPGRRVPPTGRPAGGGGAAGEVEQSGTRTDVDERPPTAIEQVDLKQFGVRQ